MRTSRRVFLKQSAGLAGLFLAGGVPLSASSQVGSILVNSVGFLPTGAKYCILRGRDQVDFSLVSTNGGEVVFRGGTKSIPGDHGDFVVGDFTELRREGQYRVVATGVESPDFSIAPDAYDSALQMCVSYFGRQRCGDSKTGHHAPCHLDDGRRSDNGQGQDVTGGWHDACDVRKWVNATLYGMTGLSRALDLLGADWKRPQIIDELRWGNQYFLKMQEPAGFVMDFCGGDDGNHWTDNIRGTADDRPIHVEPCELPSQYHFVAVQAAMARLTRHDDPVYSRQCENAAQVCIHWCLQQPTRFAASLSMAILALTQLDRAFGGDQYRQLAARFVNQLIGLQVTDQSSAYGIQGFFRSEPDSPEPYRAIMHGNLPLLALCEALERWPNDSSASLWRKRLRLNVDYNLSMSARSAFGTVPFGLYVGKDPGGNRRIGNCWYRWFMKPRSEHASSGDWWVGINAHLASNGIGLMKAARLLNDQRAAVAGQRQLDWILGANPFATSTVTAVGRNNPPIFQTDEFSPPTPPIAGGVMNGIGGSAADEAVLRPGDYHTCEYWTPMTAYTLWLLAELKAGH